MSGSLHAIIAAFLGLFGFGSPAAVYQGYGEGDYVLVAPQVGGAVEEVDVARGAAVRKGERLFALERGYEQAGVDKAKAAAAHAAAVLADLAKARRQPELDQLIAARDDAVARLQIAQINFDRDQKQITTQSISQAAFDADRAALDQARAKLSEAEAALATGKLSTGRDDAIRAAQADVASAEAALAESQWKLDQKTVVAPSDAFVFDTLMRAGEYAGVGQPVVSLLPAANIRVRFFVPGTALSGLRLGMPVSVGATGGDEPVAAHVTYIAPEAEYSPPELYNRDNRSKLLYMIEATPDANPERVHPGQPVDVDVGAP